MRVDLQFLDRGINIDRLLEEVTENSHLWDMVSTLEHTAGDKNPPGFLPLVMGVQEPGKSIKDSEGLRITEAFEKFKRLTTFLSLYGFDAMSRAAFFRLPPFQRVKTHIDDGKYYHNKDRFHLCLQGTYEYHVNGKSEIIRPGDLFWFDNKSLHSALNISDVDRITFVFDVPHDHSPIRPHTNRNFP